MNRKKNDYSIFSGSRLIESMRNGGYKNTSYAIAELIDNAIDAGAKNIEIQCQDTMNSTTGQYVLERIAILDDGCGMDEETLRRSLLFGEGNRGTNSKDIGKFGMGLPNSSLSQCKKIDVYSWQKSSEPYHSYIDVDEIDAGNDQIPKPKIEIIPEIWKKNLTHIAKKSGTLVIWNELDQATWKTSKKTLEQSEFLIGRIYRKFIVKDLKIEVKILQLNKNDVVNKKSKIMKPNDPLYLMNPSSTPGIWGEESMFKPNGKKSGKHYDINYDGNVHDVQVRYSLVEDKVRDPKNNTGEPGNTPHGRHANRNIGISIIRADREIELDTHLTISEPAERWWGAEIELPISLDKAVGLSNDKQHTTIITNMMALAKRIVGDDELDENDEEMYLKQQDITKYDLFVMIKEIQLEIRSMRRRLKASRKGTRGGKNDGGFGVKVIGGINGHEDKTSQSEKQRQELSKEQRIIRIAETLIQDGLDEKEAKERAREYVETDKKVEFIITDLSGYQFFDINHVGGMIIIKINSEHPAYRNLLTITDSDEHKGMDTQKRFELANDGLKLLLTAWAYYENLTLNKEKRRAIQNTRVEWGRELEIFLAQNEN